MVYLNLEEFIALIDEPNKSSCLRLLKDHSELFKKARGSKTKHQAWEGGYIDHIEETMNIAQLFYQSLKSTDRDLPFPLSDALLVLFLHDIEKPWKQQHNQTTHLENSSGVKNNVAIKEFQAKIISKYRFVLSEYQMNGLMYVEGEGKDYHPFSRVANELASFCHLCDHASARIWYDYPKKNSDPWKNSENRS